MKRFPHSLPKLLQSISWNNRSDVAQVGGKLRDCVVHVTSCEGTVIMLLSSTSSGVRVPSAVAAAGS